MATLLVPDAVSAISSAESGRSSLSSMSIDSELARPTRRVGVMEALATTEPPTRYDPRTSSRQSSKGRHLGRLAKNRLRELGTEPGRTLRNSLMPSAANRQSSVPIFQLPKRPSGPLKTQSDNNPEADRVCSPKMTIFPAVGSRQERSLRMKWDPPPLCSAYTQAVKYGPILAPTSSVESILRSHRPMTKKNELQPPDIDSPRKRRPMTPIIGCDSFTTKIFVLTTTGYFLQYAGEGNHDRMPESIMQLTNNSAAIACDAIPGKHWVLRVAEFFSEAEATQNARARFSLSKLGLGPKSGYKNFLLVMDSPDELDTWLVAIKRQIKSLDGTDHKPDDTNDMVIEERIHETVKPAPSKVGSIAQTAISRKPVTMAKASQHTELIQRLSKSFTKEGLLLSVEAGSEEEKEANDSGPRPGSRHDIVSPLSPTASPESESQRSQSLTDFQLPVTSRPTGRRRSSSVQMPYTHFRNVDTDCVTENVIPRHRSVLTLSSLETGTDAVSSQREHIGLRKRALVARPQHKSPVRDESYCSAPSRPLSTNFRRLSLGPDMGPVVLTPPDSPESGREITSPGEDEMVDVTVARPMSGTNSPILESHQASVGDSRNSSVAVIMHMATAKAVEVDVPRSPGLSPPGMTDERKASMSSSHINTSSKSTSWIPPRKSSLMYGKGVLPINASTDASNSMPTATRMETAQALSASNQLKMRLAAPGEAALSQAASNSSSLTPSPHPAPTGALPEIPTGRSLVLSRPTSRQSRPRAASDALGRPFASASSTATRKYSDPGRPVTPESNEVGRDGPVKQTTPRRAETEKVMIAAMAEVPATRAYDPIHPNGSTPPKLTISERRRRRSPSPSVSHCSSPSRGEKALSAIHEDIAKGTLSATGEDKPEVPPLPATIDPLSVAHTAKPASDATNPHQRQVAPVAQPRPALEPRSSLATRNSSLPNPLAANPVKAPDMRMIPLIRVAPPPVLQTRAKNTLSTEQPALDNATPTRATPIASDPEHSDPEVVPAPPRIAERLTITLPTTPIPDTMSFARRRPSATPSSPTPQMQASVTDFNQDDILMWHIPVFAAPKTERMTEQEDAAMRPVSPGTREPAMPLPLGLAGLGDVGLSLSFRTGKEEREEEKARGSNKESRWSLFEAIESIN